MSSRESATAEPASTSVAPTCVESRSRSGRPPGGQQSSTQSEGEVPGRGDHPHRDVPERVRRRLAEVPRGRAARRRRSTPGVPVGVEHEDAAAGPVAAEVRDERPGEQRSVGRVREVRQVDAHDEPDLAARGPQAHGDGAVPRPEAESMRDEREDLPGFAHPERGGLHGVSPPDRRPTVDARRRICARRRRTSGHVGVSVRGTVRLPCRGAPSCAPLRARPVRPRRRPSSRWPSACATAACSTSAPGAGLAHRHRRRAGHTEPARRDAPPRGRRRRDSAVGELVTGVPGRAHPGAGRRRGAALVGRARRRHRPHRGQPEPAHGPGHRRAARRRPGTARSRPASSRTPPRPPSPAWRRSPRSPAATAPSCSSSASSTGTTSAPSPSAGGSAHAAP